MKKKTEKCLFFHATLSTNSNTKVAHGRHASYASMRGYDCWDALIRSRIARVNKGEIEPLFKLVKTIEENKPSVDVPFVPDDGLLFSFFVFFFCMNRGPVWVNFKHSHACIAAMPVARSRKREKESERAFVSRAYSSIFKVFITGAGAGAGALTHNSFSPRWVNAHLLILASFQTVKQRELFALLACLSISLWLSLAHPCVCSILYLGTLPVSQDLGSMQAFSKKLFSKMKDFPVKIAAKHHMALFWMQNFADMGTAFGPIEVIQTGTLRPLYSLSLSLSRSLSLPIERVRRQKASKNEKGRGWEREGEGDYLFQWPCIVHREQSRRQKTWTRPWKYAAH